MHRSSGSVRPARLLASILATLALVFVGLAPIAFAQSAAPSDPLTGTWQTPPLTQAQIKGALEAAGLPPDGIDTFLANADWTDLIVWAVQFGGRALPLKGSSGGGVLQTLDQNTYRIVDDHTYVLGNSPDGPTFEYAVSGDSLILREVSEAADTSGNWHYYATALFGVAPFQRVVDGPAPSPALSPAPLTASPAASTATSAGDWLMLRGARPAAAKASTALSASPCCAGATRPRVPRTAPSPSWATSSTARATTVSSTPSTWPPGPSAGISPQHTPLGEPALDGGLLYVFDGAGTLFALDPATGVEAWHSAAAVSGPSTPTFGAGALRRQR